MTDKCRVCGHALVPIGDTGTFIHLCQQCGHDNRTADDRKRGIDYGRGQHNIDKETGIRYGIIPVNDLTEHVWDSFEADYGEATCPKCGNEALDSADEKCLLDRSKHTDRMDRPGESAYGEYCCDDCKYIFDGDEAFGDEPLGHCLDDGETKASIDSSNDCWVFLSPYYSRAMFCSPCAPGACHLRNPTMDGEKCYCMGPDWFDDDRPCEYPIWRVDNDELVYKPEGFEVNV